MQIQFFCTKIQQPVPRPKC